ncbi:DNA repair protein RecN [bacterium SCN 62-11]|nr:DNA repair protein RecN [Candidatus Eremiobacteraeota bacterium]ODT67859.1 MAG: DNA repair protein RecN [bacterium SCN 62-11]
MLVQLEIENFALIDSVQLEFREGLNVLTGETGAGKSIVLDALGFLLGDPARDNLQKRARVTGRFMLSQEAKRWLVEQGWDEDDEAIALREVSPGGRSLCRLNGSLCSLAQLRELGNLMLEIHSQHQSNRLLRPSRHLELLDRLSDHQPLLEAYRDLYRESQESARQLRELGQSERERNRQLEWLRFEVQEIEEAHLQPEEEAEIEANIRRLAAAEELGQRSRQALLHIDNALDGVGQAQKQLSALTRLDPSVSFGEQAALCETQLGELSHALNRYQDELQGEPEQLDQLQGRAELLRTLKRKYGSDVPAILAYGADARQKLADLENAEEKLEHLQSRQQELTAQLQDLAGRLTSSRQKQARMLENEVQLQLADLNLESMRFEVHQQPGELGPQGADQLEFYLAPNPGTPPRPLAKIASGGELSRIMLAVIGIFAKFEPLTTLIFDEIDAGLGGRAAEAVARKLSLLARQRQVLCVTHLAVIAAAGDQHIRVSKQSDSERTQLDLTTLTGKHREAEIARMLSGDAGAASAQRLARELLKRP